MNILIKAHGLGDCICCTPALRKLSKAHNIKFNIYSNHSIVFENLPYVNVSKNISQAPDNIDYCLFHQDNMVNSLLYDLRQFAANEIRFQLLDEEMDCDYIATNESNNLLWFGLPKEYVVIHPPNSWPIKSWGQDKWKKLCEKISLPIIIIGKTFNIDSMDYDICKVNNVIDLTNKLTVDQTWHLLNNAKYIITTDSGILHLSGTTDTPCFYIAIGKHYKLNLYKNVKPIYSNNCKFCMSNIEVIFNKKFTNLTVCQLNETNENCQPSVDQVLEAIK